MSKKFVAISLTKAKIVKMINGKNYFHAGNNIKFEPDDPRLTDQLCQQFATEYGKKLLKYLSRIERTVNRQDSEYWNFDFELVTDFLNSVPIV